MSDNKSSYRQIMKATSLFGGVQVINIIVSIVKSKFVAVFLGPYGMGIFSLLLSTMELVKAFTNFGLGISTVKVIASVNASEDQSKISTAVTVVHRWILITAIFGTLFSLFLSHWLSVLTFGNSDYTIAFAWLSVTILFSQLSAGSLAILQGMRKLQFLAKANVIGNVLGLFVTIPLYFLYKVDAIVPVLILSSVISFLFTWYFENKIKIKKVEVSGKQTIVDGKNMFVMGYVLSIGPLLAIGSSYIVRTYISKYGGITDVGLYAAGFAIINTYVGLIFNAMLTDYYPRLSAIAHNNDDCKNVANQQTELALLILSPMLVAFIVFSNLIILLLYSKEFLGITDMLYWAAISIFFKTLNWTIGIILIAKGTSKLYFWSDLIANIYILALNILGYHFWGLTGLGMSFVIGYFFGFVQLFWITKIKFNFGFFKSIYLIFTFQLALAISCFVAVKFLDSLYAYSLGIVLLIISLFYSYKELDKRIGISSIFLNLLQKFK